MNKCSLFSAIKEIKTTLRFHLSPVRMVIIFLKTMNIGEDARKMKPL
jgi:hypothetical protein